MFDLILGNDPKAFSLGEVIGWFRPTKAYHLNIKCSCGEYPCPKWNLIKGFNEKKFHREAFQHLDVEFLIDSSKDFCWVIDNNLWAQTHMSYKVYNLLVYKQPISLALSHWKRNIDFQETLNSYRYYDAFLRSNLNFYTLSYEEFIERPDDLLKAICDVVGMSYFSDKRKFWEKQHHHLFGSHGVRQQAINQNSNIYKEQIPEEFKKLIPKINREFRRNQKVNNILKRLAQRDVKLPQSFSPNVKIKKDYYYYYRKIERILRQRFPNAHIIEFAKKIIFKKLKRAV